MKREHMIHIRVNKEEKEEASIILDELGTNLSSVINMLIKNIILYKGIPFDVVLPPAVTNLEEHTEEQTVSLDEDVVSEPEAILEEKLEPMNKYAYQADTLGSGIDIVDGRDVLDTSDLDFMSDVLGVSLGQEKEHRVVENTLNQTSFDLAGMLDD